MRNMANKIENTKTEENIQDAINAYKSVSGRSMRGVAREFGISEATLRFRLKKKKNNIELQKSGRKCYFDKKVEESIANGIRDLGFKPTMSEIKGVVTDYVRINKVKVFKNGVPGQKWLYNFMKRNNITNEKSKLINSAGMDNMNINDFEEGRPVLSATTLSPTITSVTQTSSAPNDQPCCSRTSINIDLQQYLGPLPYSAPIGFQWVPNGWKLESIMPSLSSCSSPLTQRCHVEKFLNKVKPKTKGKAKKVTLGMYANVVSQPAAMEELTQEKRKKSITNVVDLIVKSSKIIKEGEQQERDEEGRYEDFKENGEGEISNSSGNDTDCETSSDEEI